MSNFTKGKWEIDGNSIQVFQRGCVCLAPKPTDGGVIERIENLQLISAAPSMYEILRELDSFAPLPREWRAKVEKVLAISEGRP